MKNRDLILLSRRNILKALAALPFVFRMTSMAHAETFLEPTPEIPDPDEPTPEQTEGPFFKPKSPERTSLREKAIEGMTLTVTGHVLFTNGKPVKGALIDVWHCDSEGVYDNDGFKLRGHQFTSEEGKFKLETIFPGVYPGRTRHIHVKVQAPGGKVLTTQMYFPNEPENARDGIFDKRLVIKMAEEKAGKKGTFDFVLRSA